MACITLLSDFGMQDASVAVARGILQQYVPGGYVLDISHDVVPFKIRQAAYLLAASYRAFPTGTCHLALFDIFSDRQPRMILAEHDGQYFLAPDNGLLPLAFGAQPHQSWQVHELAAMEGFPEWLQYAGSTIGKLQASGPWSMNLSSRLLRETVQNVLPVQNDNELALEAIHTDHYGNVVLNLTKKQFDTVGMNRQFRLEFMQIEEIAELSTGYQNVRAGQKLCRFNSAGYMEIAVNRGRAANLFGLRPFSKHNEIKITFG